MILKDINIDFRERESISLLNPGYKITQLGAGSAEIVNLQNNTALINAFNEIPEAYGPVAYMARALSKPKVRMYEGSINDLGKEITKHDILNLINRPNAMQSWHELVQQLFAYRFVTGNSYLNAFVPTGMKPKRLFVLPSQYMAVQVSKMEADQNNFDEDFRFNEIVKYILKYGKQLNIDADKVLHSRAINLDFGNGQYIFGKSPFLSSKYPITALIAGYKAKIATYQNGGPAGIITSKTDLPIPTKDKDSIDEKLARKYGLGLDQFLLMVTSLSCRLQENRLSDERALDQ